MQPVGPEAFEKLVGDALDALPDAIAEMLDNVVIVVEDDSEEDLLGLYEGIPLTERDEYGGLELPDRITIFRLPLCDMCESEDELVEEVTITVVHELAHHLGIDDDRLHELGWG